MATDMSPVDVVKAFIACVGRKDTDSMRKVIHPTGTACLIRNNEPRFMSLAESIDNLEKAEEKYVEVLWDEIEHIDGDYAVVWTKFRIDREGELHQTGTSSFSCWKSPDLGWIILNMSDIARSPNDTARG